MKNFLRVFFAAAILSAPAQAFAMHICWIDHAVKVDGGINIYFQKKPVMQATMQAPDKTPPVEYQIVNSTVSVAGGTPQDHLFLKDGFQVSLQPIPEDTCTLTVGDHGVVKGIDVHNVLHLPGSSGEQESREFVVTTNP